MSDEVIETGSWRERPTGRPVAQSREPRARHHSEHAGVSIAYAVPDITGSKITIHLDRAVPAGKTAKVAWFIVN